MRTLRLAALVLLALPIHAGHRDCDLDVIVDGQRRMEYGHGGTTYVEALRGRDYTLRLTNPTPHRVAVALSVDGLNTIDAKHTDAWRAAKWVLDPHETVEISGWQVSDRAARRFFFTGERDSYGAKIGRTENLGVIEAVFYRERPAVVVEPRVRQEAASARAPNALSEAGAAPPKGLEDDFAATGMGGRTRHEVRRVDIDLEPAPVASVRIRYEFRPQLVKLGVLPAAPDPLGRRESARGFGSYCPEPE